MANKRIIDYSDASKANATNYLAVDNATNGVGKVNVTKLGEWIDSGDIPFESTNVSDALSEHFSGTTDKHATDKITTLYTGSTDLKTTLDTMIGSTTTMATKSLTDLDAHIAGTADKHAAGDITYDGGTVEEALNSVVGISQNNPTIFNITFTSDNPAVDVIYTDTQLLAMIGFDDTEYALSPIGVYSLSSKNALQYRSTAILGSGIVFDASLGTNSFTEYLDTVTIKASQQSASTTYLFSLSLTVVKK